MPSKQKQLAFRLSEEEYKQFQAFRLESLESFYYLTREIARRKLHKVFKEYLKTGVLPRGIG